MSSKEKSQLIQFLDDINHVKQDNMDILNERQYVPFLINHFLSGTVDTVIAANEMNMQPFLDNKMQYKYLLNAVRKKKRFAPWLKREKYYDMKKIQLVKDYFGYTFDKAKEALKILSDEDLKMMKQRMSTGTGGTSGKK